MPGTIDTVMQVLGLALLHFLWQGLLLGIVFAILMRLLRDTSAQARYACAVGALVVVFLMPFATSWWLLSQAAGGSAPVGSALAAGALQGSAAVTAISAADGGMLAWGLELMPMVVCAWLGGVLLLTARMILDARYVRWLKRSADTSVPFDLAGAMERFCDQLQLSRQRIELGITPHVSTALVVGWLRPMVLLPAAVIGQLPLRQLELILAHELAHIRRHDPIVNLFQVVVETVLFYHPVVRMISRRIRIERENCTDDLVVRISRDSMSYARALTALEELRGASIRLSIGAVDGDFARRIRRLFRPPRRQKGMLGAGIVSAITALLMVFANVAAWQLQQWRDSESAADVEVVQSTASENIDAAPELSRPVVEPESTAEPAAVDTPSPADVAAAGNNETADVVEPVPVEIETSPPADTVTAAADDSEDISEPPPVAEEAPTPSTRPEARSAVAEPVEESAAIEVAEPVTEQAPASVPEEVVEVPAQSIGLADTPDEVTTQATVNEPEVSEPVAFEPDTALAYVPPEPVSEAASEPKPEPVLHGGRLIEMRQPKYPTRARLRGIEAEVRLSFVIDADGRPRDIELLNMPADDELGFGRAARRAVRKWRFEPFTLEGETVEKRVEQILDFSLTGEQQECGPVTGTRIGSWRSNRC